MIKENPKEMLRAWTELMLELSLKHHNSVRDTESAYVLEYLLDTVIPDEIEFWQSESEGK